MVFEVSRFVIVIPWKTRETKSTVSCKGKCRLVVSKLTNQNKEASSVPEATTESDRIKTLLV